MLIFQTGSTSQVASTPECVFSGTLWTLMVVTDTVLCGTDRISYVVGLSVVVLNIAMIMYANLSRESHQHWKGKKWAQ